jgi:hypothetical protein
MQQALFIGGGLALYPTANQHLQSIGFSSGEARNRAPLLPTFVKPLPMEWKEIDILHETTIFPTAYGVLIGLNRAFNSADQLHSAFPFGDCSVAIPHNKILARNIFSHPAYPYAPESPITLEDVNRYIFLHELGHCRRADGFDGTTIYDLAKKLNLRSDRDMELEADLSAINKKDKNAALFFKYLRGGGLDLLFAYEFMIKHDISLNLDRTLQNRELLKDEEIIAARIEVANALKEFSEKWDPQKQATTNLSFFANIAVRLATMMDSTDLSANAFRRAELYVESFAYFRPLEFGRIKHMMPARIVVRVERNVANSMVDPFAPQDVSIPENFAKPAPSQP